MNRALKGVSIFLGIILFLFGGFYLFIHFSFDGIFTGPSYNKKDLIENYEARTNEIIDVKNYYKSILPDEASVEIEFKNDKELRIFHVKSESIFQNNWDLKLNTPKVDSLLTQLNWTKNELEILKEKLDKANCISIAGNDPVVIGWQRSGMGLFSYSIFDNNLEKDKIEEYNDNCSYSFYKNNIVLKYEGGAIGPQCFQEFYKKKGR